MKALTSAVIPEMYTGGRWRLSWKISQAAQKLVTRSPSSGRLARERRWLARDTTVCFALVSAGFGSKQLTLLYTVMVEQTKKRPKTADDETLKKGANSFHVVLLRRRGKASN